MFRHKLEYAGVRSLIAAVRLMPPSVVDACGSALGATFHALDRGHRRVALANVAAAFPTRTPAEHAAIVRGTFRLHHETNITETETTESEGQF